MNSEKYENADGIVVILAHGYEYTTPVIKEMNECIVQFETFGAPSTHSGGKGGNRTRPGEMVAFIKLFHEAKGRIHPFLARINAAGYSTLGFQIRQHDMFHAHMEEKSKPYAELLQRILRSEEDFMTIEKVPSVDFGFQGIRDAVLSKDFSALALFHSKNLKHQAIIDSEDRGYLNLTQIDDICKLGFNVIEILRAILEINNKNYFNNLIEIKVLDVDEDCLIMSENDIQRIHNLQPENLIITKIHSYALILFMQFLGYKSTMFMNRSCRVNNACKNVGTQTLELLAEKQQLVQYTVRLRRSDRNRK